MCARGGRVRQETTSSETCSAAAARRDASRRHRRHRRLRPHHRHRPRRSRSRRPRTSCSRRRRSTSSRKSGVLKPVYFAYDSDRPDRRGARHPAEERRDWMKRWTSTKVMVEGHADSRGTNEYNLALGERRAERGARLPGEPRRRRGSLSRWRKGKSSRSARKRRKPAGSRTAAGTSSSRRSELGSSGAAKLIQGQALRLSAASSAIPIDRLAAARGSAAAIIGRPTTI